MIGAQSSSIARYFEGSNTRSALQFCGFGHASESETIYDLMVTYRIQ